MASSGKKTERDYVSNCTYVDAALSQVSAAACRRGNAERRSLAVHMPVIALRQFRCDQGCAFILSAGNCNASNPLLSVEQDEAGGQSVEAV